MTTRSGRLGWGLLGVGRHADRFVAPAIRQSATAELVAVYSRDQQRAGEFAERHGGPAAHASLDAFIEEPGLDAVYVCSPNHVHREHVLRAARARKHVLCEKPLATNVGDAREMVEACRDADVRLGVGFNLRHNPVHARAREMVASGALGEPLLAEIQYMHVTAGARSRRESAAWASDARTRGGGSFMGTGVHALDLLRFILNREITHVVGVADSGWGESGYERLIQISALLDGGLPASLSGGNLPYPANQLAVYGSSATLRCTGSIGYTSGGRLDLVSGQGAEAIDFPECNIYAREVDAFAASIHSGAVPNASGEDGLRVVEITLAIYESIRQNRLIEVESEGKA